MHLTCLCTSQKDRPFFFSTVGLVLILGVAAGLEVGQGHLVVGGGHLGELVVFCEWPMGVVFCEWPMGHPSLVSIILCSSSPSSRSRSSSSGSSRRSYSRSRSPSPRRRRRGRSRSRSKSPFIPTLEDFNRKRALRSPDRPYIM